MRISWVVVLAACGRIDFDPRVNADAARDAVPDSVSDADLISWVPLDDTQFMDVITGALGSCGTACPTPVVGHSGMAMHFDGSTMCLLYEDLAARYSPANITISIWANEDSPLGARECQVSKRVDISTTISNSWQLETVATVDQESFTSSHNSLPPNHQMTALAGMIKAGQWQHLVATFDGTTKVLYIDGAEAASAGPFKALVYDTHPMIIGCDDNAGLGEHYQGALDELRIYKRALSPAEVQALP